MRETRTAKFLRVIMCGYIMAMIVLAFIVAFYNVAWENNPSAMGTSVRDRMYLDGVDYFREW